MTDCLFCKIVAGDMDADIVYRDDDVVGFRDINPQAPHHVLFVPRRHVPSLNELDAGNAELIGQLFLAARQYAADNSLSESGWRSVINCGEGAGQSVFHLHLHLLAGRGFEWPPG